MDWRAAFKGEFIKAVEFQGKEPTLTITDVRVVKVEDEKTKRNKDKLVVYFKEVDRGWIPCKTACICIAGMFGTNNTEEWHGKRVTLFSDPTVKFGSDTVEGVRVKGSPDITRQVKVMVKLPKKRPHEHVMMPTGKPQQPKANGAAKPAEPPQSVVDAVEALGGEIIHPDTSEQPDDIQF